MLWKTSVGYFSSVIGTKDVGRNRLPADYIFTTSVMFFFIPMTDKALLPFTG